MKILIATKSDIKIKGIFQAFEDFFSENIEFEAIATPSGVEEQPSNEQVYIGAFNRLNEAKKIKKESFDYYISCESGLIFQGFQYFNVQVVCMFFNNQYTYGFSSGFPIPTKEISNIMNSSLKDIFDERFDGKGGISYLTQGLSSREKLVKDATIMALSYFNWNK